MTCRVIAPGVIVCGRERTKPCSTPHCGGRGVRLCDYPTPGGKSTTCSAAICARCATKIGELDYCRAHLMQRLHAPADTPDGREIAAGLCAFVAWSVDTGAR